MSIAHPFFLSSSLNRLQDLNLNQLSTFEVLHGKESKYRGQTLNWPNSDIQHSDCKLALPQET